ncbi:MAG TPA: hypothetical protein VGM36_11370, partial [Rhizomicrobium sp.]
MSSPGISSFDPSLLISYYNAKVSANLVSRTASGASSQSAAATAATPKSTLTPPWDSSIATPSDQALDAQAMADTPYLDLSGVSNAATTTGEKLDQDNEKMFALYQGLNRIAYLATMGTRDGMTSGQLSGLNTRFQDGLSQIQDYLSSASFNGLTLLPGAKSDSITSTASVPLADTKYLGGVVVKGDALFQPVPKVSASDSFSIAVTKGGNTTNVNIDLSGVTGPLTLD